MNEMAGKLSCHTKRYFLKMKFKLRKSDLEPLGVFVRMRGKTPADLIHVFIAIIPYFIFIRVNKAIIVPDEHVIEFIFSKAVFECSTIHKLECVR
jgi:hypothetical protein